MVRKISMNHIAKVEGHANLTVKIENGKITKCDLAAFEGARFFEGLIKGKKYSEVIEIVTRICGICSSAHGICAAQTLESAFGINVSEQTKTLRKMMTIGERIRSHVTHLYFMTLPDYLGFDSALAMAKHKKEELNRALRIMQFGNNILDVISGRDMHTLCMQVGGFTKVPKQQKINELYKKSLEIYPDILKTADLFSKLKYPKFERKTEYLSLKKENEYPIIDGGLYSYFGKLEENDYKQHISENLEEYSTSKFALKDGKTFMVGALARINNNYENLHEDAKKFLKKEILPINNPFYNNACQAIELVHLTKELEYLLKNLKIKNEKISKISVKKGHSVGCLEAPRGVLFHEYKVKSNGFIDYVNIMTPTVQNLKKLEEDIKLYLEGILHLKKEQIVLEIEKLIRAYDPCFSCSTHFLNIKWE